MDKKRVVYEDREFEKDEERMFFSAPDYFRNGGELPLYDKRKKVKKGKPKKDDRAEDQHK